MAWQSQYGDRSSYRTSDRTYPSDLYYTWPCHASSHSEGRPSARPVGSHLGINYGPVPCGPGGFHDTSRDSRCALLTLELLLY